MNGETKLISVGDLFRQSWGLYRERALVLVGILVGPVVVSTIGVVLAETSVGGAGFLGDVLVLIGGILYFVASLALLYQLKDNSGVGSSYGTAFRNILSYLWLEIITTFMILGGVLLLIVPGIIFAIWLLFPIYLLVFEGERRMRAVLKSREYVRSHWWQVVGRLLVLLIVLGIPYLLILIAVGEDPVVSNITGSVIELIMVPFGAIYFYFLYKGLKEVSPEITDESLGRSRKLLIFSGALGVLAAAVILVLAITLGFIKGGDTNDYLPDGLPDRSPYQLELPQ